MYERWDVVDSRRLWLKFPEKDWEKETVVNVESSDSCHF